MLCLRLVIEMDLAIPLQKLWCVTANLAQFCTIQLWKACSRFRLGKTALKFSLKVCGREIQVIGTGQELAGRADTVRECDTLTRLNYGGLAWLK